MALYIVGINHRTAPVELRERVAFDPSALPDALHEMTELHGVHEGAIISTCNRTELYCVADENGPAHLRDWLSRRQSLDDDVQRCLFLLDEEHAIAHAFSVASGLDSMVVGEPQILGQMKDAYTMAADAGTTGPLLNRLFQQAFAVAKHVRSTTDIGAHSVSLASTAVRLAGRVFAGFEHHTALLVGAGETIELVATHLHGQRLQRMIIANRSIDRAHALGAAFNAYAIGLDDIAVHLADADILISSTASPEPIVTAAMLTEVQKNRRQRPMFIADLAVPRDIDPAAADLPNIYLYTIDDLEELVEESLEIRRQAAEDAEFIVREEARRFDDVLRGLDAVPLIRSFRDTTRQLRNEALESALRQLRAGGDPEEVVTTLARNLTRKLAHGPTRELREAAEHSEEELARVARRLLGKNGDD